MGPLQTGSHLSFRNEAASTVCAKSYRKIVSIMLKIQGKKAIQWFSTYII
jgi:hypothetical protein